MINKQMPLPWYSILLKKIFRIILYFIKYPFVMKNSYAFLNFQLTEMMKAIPRDPGAVNELDQIRKKNRQNINLFIFLPMFIGLILNIFVFIKSGDDGIQRKYVVYYNRMTLPIKGDTSIRKGINLITRIVKGTIHNPVSLQDFYYFINGYGISILGALLLKLNPMFSEQKRIESVLLNMKKLDPEGKPWKILWTPNFIMMEVYGSHADEVFNDKKFWSTINFYPEMPIKDVGGNSNKFIFPKKYKLPDAMEFIYTENTNKR